MTEEIKVIGRPMAFASASELRAKCEEYFAEWKRQDRPFTVVGLAGFLDVTRDTLCEYGKGTYDGVDRQFSDTVKKAKEYIETYKWEGGLTGKYNSSMAQFDLKNNHGAVDKSEVEQMITTTESPTKELLIQKAKEQGLPTEIFSK